MKLISWNCNMAFRKKAAHVIALQPDILVIPECEHPDKLIFDKNIPAPANMLWFGTNVNKGLGVFCYGDYRLRLLDYNNPELKMIVPIEVQGVSFQCTLYAVWANNPADKQGAYVTQVWKAIQCYDKHLSSGLSILAGDFNSNSIWDRPRRNGNHSHVVEFLRQRDIHSVYHLHHRLEHGKEKHPTQYMYRHRDKPYHLDYCFVSGKLANDLTNVEVGKHRYWCKYSDHVPLIATFN